MNDSNAVGNIIPNVPVDMNVQVDVTFNKLWLVVIAIVAALSAMCMYMWVKAFQG
jgi:hypothetical protein